MRTILPESITCVEDARSFIQSLCDKHEQYHPEDDAHDVCWQTTKVSWDEAERLNLLMGQIYALPEVPEKYDPCGHILEYLKLEDEF